MITLTGPGCSATFNWGADRPVRLSTFAPVDGQSMIAPHPMVLVFTTAEQQLSRMSHAYADSAIGARLRYISHELTSDRQSVLIEQGDPLTGIHVRSTVRVSGSSALSFLHEVTNEGALPLVVTAISSLHCGFASSGPLDDAVVSWGESGWTVEHRWHESRLGDVLAPFDVATWGNDLPTRFARTSSGPWSTAEYLPTAVIAAPDGRALGWQIEGSGPWHWEFARTREGGYLSVLGPTHAESQFAVRLAPGENFTAPAAAVAVSSGGRDGAIAALTDHRRALRELRPADHRLPVVYNDYMNTLMGDPTSEKLLPLVHSAAEVGAEYFCIDAGWFADTSGADWWNSVGEWAINEDRFPGGLLAVIDAIRASGMRPGLWLEPEVVGINSPLADQLPEDAFFHQFGERVITQERYHLDFRHEAARAHLDDTLERLVRGLGIEYFKLDYNINPVGGTTIDAFTAGEGLLGHVRAHREWLRAAQHRYPAVLFENCASGAMRADYGLLSIAHQQSTSDQHDAVLYAAIAAGAPASILPEQCANWAYPTVEMDFEQTAFSLVAGLAGRLYLAGFLPRLRPEQRGLVSEAVSISKAWRSRLSTSHPVWPLGLPAWDAPQCVVAFDCGGDYLVAAWSRGEPSRVALAFDARPREVEQVFPSNGPLWATEIAEASLIVDFPAGPGARLFRVAHASASAGEELVRFPA